MIDISISNLSKEFEVGKKILDGLTFQVDQGERVGLLGKNGAGKTTLFKVLTGELDWDEGEVHVAPGKGVGLISQIPVYPPAYTVEDVLQTAFDRLHAMEAEMARLAEQMGADTDPALLRRYDALTAAFEAGGGYDTQTELNKVCNGLEISQDMRGQLFSSLSGGEKTRVNLARLILEDTDILLLDEPINGLDPEGIVEFRELLLRLNRERQTTILISSHILSELSALATHYAFIDRGRMLETISAADLRERCRDCLELRVDDAARAAQVLEEQLGTRDFEVLPQERLRLYAFLDQPQTVNRVLMEQGVGLISAQQKDSNLEDYFLSLIDGHSAGKEGV